MGGSWVKQVELDEPMQVSPDDLHRCRDGFTPGVIVSSRRDEETSNVSTLCVSDNGLFKKIVNDSLL